MEGVEAVNQITLMEDTVRESSEHDSHQITISNFLRIVIESKY